MSNNSNNNNNTNNDNDEKVLYTINNYSFDVIDLVITILVIIFSVINVMTPYFIKDKIGYDNCKLLLMILIIISIFISLLTCPIFTQFYLSPKNIVKYRDTSVFLSSITLLLSGICAYLLPFINQNQMAQPFSQPYATTT